MIKFVKIKSWSNIEKLSNIRKCLWEKCFQKFSINKLKVPDGYDKSVTIMSLTLRKIFQISGYFFPVFSRRLGPYHIETSPLIYGKIRAEETRNLEYHTQCYILFCNSYKSFTLCLK